MGAVERACMARGGHPVSRQILRRVWYDKGICGIYSCRFMYRVGYTWSKRGKNEN